MNIGKVTIKSNPTLARGDLCAIELPVPGTPEWDLRECPFEPRRAFWINRMPALARRGGHAHKEGEQFIVALHGSVQVNALGPGGVKTRFNLSKPEEALYVPAMHWLEITNTNAKTALLVLASNKYEERDYVRDFEQFKEMSKA